MRYLKTKGSKGRPLFKELSKEDELSLKNKKMSSELNEERQ